MSDAKSEKKLPEWAKRERLSKEAVKERLRSAADAAWGVAIKEQDPDIRDGYMDRCHMLREALRHLG